MSAYFDDKPLSGIQPIRWQLTDGVVPYVTRILVKKELAEEISENEVHTLRIGDQTFEGIRLLRIEHGLTLNQRSLVLADNRYPWTHAWVSRYFNLVRRTGLQENKSTTTSTRFSPARPAPAKLFRYVQSTVKSNGSPYSLREMLDFISQDIEEQVESSASIVIEDAIPDRLVENLALDGPGHLAYNEFLSRVSDYKFAMRKDGKVAFRRKLTGDSKIFTVKDSWRRSGTPAIIAENTIPSKIVVLFEREMEVRVNYVSYRTFSRQNQYGIFMQNVVQLPDHDLKFVNFPYTAGSYVELFYLLGVYDLLTRPSASRTVVPILNIDFMRRYAPNNFSWIGQLFWIDNNGQFDQAWKTRLDHLAQGFRQLFQLSASDMDKFLRIKTSLVAPILENVSQGRARSPVWCDFIVRPSWKGVFDHKGSYGFYGTVHETSVFDGSNLENEVSSPFHLRLVDGETGVLQVSFDQPFSGEIDKYILGKPDGTNIGVRLNPRAFNRDREYTKALWEYISTDRVFRLASIITVTPLVPNSHFRYHIEEFDSEELTIGEGLSPANFNQVQGKPVILKGKGPPLYLKVPPELLTAKIRWTRLTRHKILQLLKGENVRPLTDNFVEVRTVAEAMATAAISRFIGRAVGRVAMSPSKVPMDGPEDSANSIEYTVQRSGSTEAVINLVNAAPVTDFNAFLTEEVRKVVFRQLAERGW